jgi:hypothetical protein
MSGVPSRQARLAHAAKHAEYYPMPEHVGAESDPYTHLLTDQ